MKLYNLVCNCSGNKLQTGLLSGFIVKYKEIKKHKEGKMFSYTAQYSHERLQSNEQRTICYTAIYDCGI